MKHELTGLAYLDESEELDIILHQLIADGILKAKWDRELGEFYYTLTLKGVFELETI